jgi:CheY-like chemotaxis protein
VKPLILIIEDNPLNMELFTDLLEAADFAVVQTRTAEEGLRVAGKLLPALILMDLSLPGMDGLAATRKLKADPATEHLPVVALTAHAMRGDNEIAIRAGCDGYISKPIEAHRFADQIRSYLSTHTLCKPKR